eukprot:10981689-Heterocapsa_arctica.AAC.1
MSDVFATHSALHTRTCGVSVAFGLRGHCQSSSEARAPQAPPALHHTGIPRARRSVGVSSPRAPALGNPTRRRFRARL